MLTTDIHKLGHIWIKSIMHSGVLLVMSCWVCAMFLTVLEFATDPIDVGGTEVCSFFAPNKEQILKDY
jgi:hypothetical protein